MTRRALFAALLAPFLARFLPKAKPKLEPMRISMRIWRGHDVASGHEVTRLDVLCGFYVPQPRTCCKVIL